MKLRLERREEWVEVTRGDEKAKFLVCPLTPEEVEKGFDKAMETEWDKGQRFKDLNPFKYKLWKIKKVIKDWDLKDENDKPILCSNAMKEMIFNLYPDIIDEVLDKSEELTKLYGEELGEERKNLSGGQSGPPTSTE